MPNIAALTTANSLRWAAARVLPYRKGLFDSVAKRLLPGKPRYLAVSADTGVPWYVIAVIHEREASGAWTANIAQGDPWNRASIHVPKGRGPFTSWEKAAYDALMRCTPYAGLWKDWSAGGTMSILEQYNGLGYFNKGLPSPYNWAGTDQYQKGKYIRDGVFDPNAVDQQLGCAGILLSLAVLDKSVADGLKMAFRIPPPPDIHPITPKPAPSFGSRVLDFFRPK